MSYFEIETQLLTFRKDLLPYEFAYHLIVPNRNENKKVESTDTEKRTREFSHLTLGLSYDLDQNSPGGLFDIHRRSPFSQHPLFATLLPFRNTFLASLGVAKRGTTGVS